MSVDASSPAPAAEPTRLEILSREIAAALPAIIHPVPNHTRELTYEAAADRLLEVATVLRDAPHLKFEMCMDVCGVDYLEHGRAEWKTQDATASGFSRGVARSAHAPAVDGPPGRRFAVVYHLLSLAHNHRVRLRVF